MDDARRILFNPEPLSPFQEKSPNARVTEGHQEFEPGYVRGWEIGDSPNYPMIIMNMRGQQIKARRAQEGGFVMATGGKVRKVMHEFKHGELHSGSKSGPMVKSRKQAIAIALSEARKAGEKVKKKALGGINLKMPAVQSPSYNLRHQGLLNSSIPGRTDKLPMRVKSGSYVVPADIVSGLGQGNSMAGGAILKNMFNTGPLGIKPMHPRGTQPPRLRPMMKQPHLQEGGEADEGEDDHVPIIAAGGEFIISPEAVQHVGHGDINAGHKVLDRLMLKFRKKNIEDQKKLKPPKK